MADIEKRLLPICAWCRKIRINGEWIGENFPNYEFIVASYDGFTHGICEEDTERCMD